MGWTIYQDSPHYGCNDNPSYKWFAYRVEERHIMQNAGPFASLEKAKDFVALDGMTQDICVKQTHLTADAILLFATNERSLYERHKELARVAAGLAAWESHVQLAVLPTYRREMREPTAAISRVVEIEAAKLLSDYYWRHVHEEGA